MTIAPRFVLVALGVFLPFAAFAPAQEGPPTPSPELKKLEPMIGNWAGSGTMTEPGAVTKWAATGSYRWVLGGFFVQEDFKISFAGMPDPLVFRAYFGWDAERKTFVNLSANNGGEVQANDFTLLPDGTVLQVMVKHQQGLPYAERWRMKVDGDTMTHTIDMLMSEGPSMKVVDGTFAKQDAAAPSALDAKGTWMEAQPNESMQKLARMAGSYETKGDMVMMPGAPVMKIKGTDTYRPIFGGTVLYARTDGEADGMPGKYECDSFWAWNSKKECFVAIIASNMGEVGAMEARFAPDGKALIGTMAFTTMGQPTVVRSVIGLDDKGQPKSFVVHMLMGTAAPLENFNATCTKK